MLNVCARQTDGNPLLPAHCPAEYGCFHPIRDIVTPPFEGRAELFAGNAKKKTIDELIASKKK